VNIEFKLLRLARDLLSVLKKTVRRLSERKEISWHTYALMQTTNFRWMKNSAVTRLLKLLTCIDRLLTHATWGNLVTTATKLWMNFLRINEKHTVSSDRISIYICATSVPANFYEQETCNLISFGINSRVAKTSIICKLVVCFVKKSFRIKLRWRATWNVT
jgi:hypothetical protein